MSNVSGRKYVVRELTLGWPHKIVRRPFSNIVAKEVSILEEEVTQVSFGSLIEQKQGRRRQRDPMQ